jgi:hypothetical protein
MKTITCEKISNQLGLSGWDIEILEPTSEEEVYTTYYASQPNNPYSFRFYETRPHFVLFQMIFICQKPHSAEIDSIINKMVTARAFP